MTLEQIKVSQELDELLMQYLRLQIAIKRKRTELHNALEKEST